MYYSGLLPFCPVEADVFGFPADKVDAARIKRNLGGKLPDRICMALERCIGGDPPRAFASPLLMSHLRKRGMAIHLLGVNSADKVSGTRCGRFTSHRGGVAANGPTQHVRKQLSPHAVRSTTRPPPRWLSPRRWEPPRFLQTDQCGWRRCEKTAGWTGLRSCRDTRALVNVRWRRCDRTGALDTGPRET